MIDATKNSKKYEATKLFIGGLLAGLTYVEQTDIDFAVGFVCESPIGGSPYRIVAARSL